MAKGFNWTRVATQQRMRTHGTQQIEPKKKIRQRQRKKSRPVPIASKCNDECQVFLQETSNSIHHSCLRCKEHGFIKWLSYDQHCELAKIMYQH